MTETVVSMAMSLVGSAIRVASSASSQEMSMLIGVQNEIWFIKDELKTMQAFLRAAEVRKDQDELVKVWAEQVRDLAYDIEDCLQEFAVHVGHQSLSMQLIKLCHRHRIAVQIRNLKQRVEEVSNRNMRYNLIKSVPSSSTDDSQSNMELIRYQTAHYVNESELVGFDVPKKEILELVSSSENAEAQTIWIVGEGGLGKTTLAKKVYESSDVSSKFPCRAWITVSRSFNVKDLLKNMIKQLLGEDSLKKLLDEHKEVIVEKHNLTDHLNKGLRGRRYFLVLDDLWTTQAWDCIKPTSWGNNMEGSRVVVTTRNKNLAGGSSTSPVYCLKTLEKEDATKLLLRKTKRSLHDIEKDQMKEIFEKILKKCGGLPLAIITIGAVLEGKDIKEWEILYAQLPSELESNPIAEPMKKVVTLSYNYLPSHLKPCFLYLCIFPEDFDIQRKRLVHRWIAEGFIRARGGVGIVDVAQKYFDELINRSMIQASRVDIEGNIKSCRVHDIMRDVMISISREENFVYLMGDDGTSVVEENIRHLVHHDTSKCSNIGMDWSHVRSLTLFGNERPKGLSPSFCFPQLKMLRVLDLQDVKFGMTQKDIGKIGLLRHLKYVNIGGHSSIYALPRCIGKLKDLCTLDITDSYITELPTEISKLQSLCILRCRGRPNSGDFNLNDPKDCLIAFSCLPLLMAATDSDERNKIIAELHVGCSSQWSPNGGTYGVRVPRGIKNLKRLQVLETVDINRTSSKSVEELGELIQLRKLSVVTQGSTKEKCKILCTAIQKLTSLKTLYLNAHGPLDTGTLEWLHSISHLPSLRIIRLIGYMKEMPNWFRELRQLVKIHLQNSQLEEDKTMEILGELPNLMLLFLSWRAYAGGKLVFREGTF
ncbi:hypothetical protein DAI22_06g119000 [Oryza sativa Japonica Group]|jgi:disease resistance protein RPM1|nr:hypothetical protein DAI22_06g119000 [Oryza sativa Japonica Group]